jgi:DNA-binding MarR family transcriptional regulator
MGLRDPRQVATTDAAESGDRHMDASSDTSIGDVPRSPWHDLDETGENLIVHEFLTVKLSALMSSLRRKVTASYARPAGLSVPEWRLLALVAESGTVSFGALVVQSTTDKAQVSRTLKHLERDGLIVIEPESENDRKRLACSITPAGQELHDRIIGTARQMQAEVICQLSPVERDQFYRALARLQTFMDDEAEAEARRNRGAGVLPEAGADDADDADD